jgi:acetolactate synthase-1/2/3 large subunit
LADGAPITGADVIADAIVARGLKRVFVYPGGTIAPVLDKLQARGVELFVARHEQGAAYAALAAARLLGEPQVAMVTSGPGVTNVVTCVADAYFDSTPLVLLTGQVGTGDMRRELPVRQRGFQEIDSVALMTPITKACLLPMTPAEVPQVMADAFRIAAEGRPGPVLVDLPMNVQRGEVPAGPEAGSPQSSAATPAPFATPEPEPAAIAQLAEWLAAAERPVIIAGQGVLLAHATAELRALVQGAGIPTSQSLLGLGAFPTNSPLALGFHGHTGNQYAGLAIHNADLLIAIGSRLDVRQTGGVVGEFVPNGRVVRIDLDAAELANSRVRVDLAINADARETLAALNAALAGRTLPDWSSWRARIDAWRCEHPLSYAPNGPLKPQFVVETANRLTAGHPLTVVSGVGSHQQWAARHFDFDAPERVWLTSGGHGAMGYDLPTAIGAAMARPGIAALCFVGDGSFQMNIQELAVLAERKLPVKVFVLDNHRLGIVSHFQNLTFGSDPTTGDKWNPDFAAVAAAYGIPSGTGSAPSQVEPLLREALAATGPFLAHFIVDPAEDVSPMLLAGQTMDAMWSDR